MGTPHKHAALIKAWADGAEIQIFDDKEWVDNTYPAWHPDNQYRVKPKAININGYEVPQPVREPLELGQDFYFVSTDSDVLVGCSYWCNDTADERLLSRGLIHLNRADAQAHARALLSFTEAK